MRKLIFMLVALFATFSLSAQTVVSSKLTDDVYVGVNTGVSMWMHAHTMGYDGHRDAIRSVSSVRVGKYLLPTVGFELEGQVGMANRDKFVDHVMLGGNLLFNVNNMVHKYKGEPDKFEFVSFVGLGWHHTTDVVTNNIASKMGMQVNYNFGKEKQWQINLIPSMNYVMTDNGFGKMTGQPRFDIHRAYLNGQVGVTYKFRNSKKTHNFVLCPYKYTKDDYDKWVKLMNESDKALATAHSKNKEYSDLLMAKQKEIDALNAREMVVNETVVLVNAPIGFEIGKSKLLKTQRAALETIADAVKGTDTKLNVVGYADAKTGTKARNLKLSEERAMVVKDALVKLGVKEENINVVYMGDTEQPFKENDLNRVVVFSVK